MVKNHEIIILKKLQPVMLSHIKVPWIEKVLKAMMINENLTKDLHTNSDTINLTQTPSLLNS